MKESKQYMAVRLPEETRKRLREVAAARFEGNESMAMREAVRLYLSTVERVPEPEPVSPAALHRPVALAQ